MGLNKRGEGAADRFVRVGRDGSGRRHWHIVAIGIDLECIEWKISDASRSRRRSGLAVTLRRSLVNSSFAVS